MSVFIRVTIDIPDQLFDYKVFEDTLMRGQDELTKKTGDDFELSAMTFSPEDQPKIIIESTKKEGDVYKSAAIAEGKAYYYMNFGAPRHKIPLSPKAKGFLKFPHGSGFMPKTQPGTITPQQGANTGEDVFAKQIDHPGSQGRRIDLAIAAKHKDDLKPIGLAAIQAGLKAAK